MGNIERLDEVLAENYPDPADRVMATLAISRVLMLKSAEMLRDAGFETSAGMVRMAAGLVRGAAVAICDEDDEQDGSNDGA